MNDEYRGKTFKSGNSVALRLPRGLGIPEGVEVRVVKEAGMTFRVEPVTAPRRKIDVASFWGKAPGLILPPREDFEERPSTLAALKKAADEGGVIQFLIDSDCAVYATTGRFPALAHRLSEYEPGDIGISAISFAEVMLGSVAGKPPTVDLLDAFIRAIPIVPFDEAASRAYAALPFKRARFDRLLAAHAISLDVTIVTNNEIDFAEIPGLRVENWTK